MALDQRKRQRKAEKRNARQRANRKRALAQRQPQDLSFQFRHAADVAPVLHCVVIADIWDEGIGHVLISRQLANGQVAFVDFLVDTYCLGVKNVFLNVLPRDRYLREMYGRLDERYTLQKLQPECARKLVEGAVEYAGEFGIGPHKDYRTAQLIFGDIDAAACGRRFDFGKDGKPFFVGGPHDDEQRCRRIVSMLHDSCGPDGYHYVLPLAGDIDRLT